MTGASPPYDAAAIAALEAQTASLLAEFASWGAERIEPAIVQSADAFLDRMGEELRRRTYVFAGPDGTELCLRPDLTIPAAQTYLARVPGCDRPLKLCYSGPVFRHDPEAPDRPGQSFQAGVESFNDADLPKADVDALLLTHKALTRAGLKQAETTLGDLGLFASLLEALSLPPHWQQKLRRHAWQATRTEELLKRLGAPAATSNGFLGHIGSLPPSDARAVLGEALALGGIKAIGARTIDEIADRFIERAADSTSAPLPEQAARLITSFLDLKLPASNAVEALRALTASAGVSINPAIDALDRRLDLLNRSGFALGSATFASRFGRNLEYYTGFVFELRPKSIKAPVAGGGRYDNLLTALGAPKPAPAIGLAIFGDRLAAALRAGA